MKIKVLSTVIVVLVAGCGTAAKNPQEFRQSVTNGSMGFDKNSFVANRALSDIAKTFEVKSKECLNVKVERVVTMNTKYGPGSESSTFMTYRAKVISTGKQLALNVQIQITGSAFKVQEEPEDGYYLFAADVSPIDKSRSNVTLYFNSKSNNLLEAVKGWTTGTSLKCPDLSKDI
jgi:hypothetical protein